MDTRRILFCFIFILRNSIYLFDVDNKYSVTLVTSDINCRST